MLRLYTVVLLLAPTNKLIGTRVAKAASMKAVPSIGGGRENQPSTTVQVASVQSPAPERAMTGESRLEISTEKVTETHRADVQRLGQDTDWVDPVPRPMVVIAGRRGPKKACS